MALISLLCSNLGVYMNMFHLSLGILMDFYVTRGYWPFFLVFLITKKERKTEYELYEIPFSFAFFATLYASVERLQISA